MHDLPFTYLSTTQHLWHLMNGHVNEWHGIKMKENPNLTCDSKQAYDIEVQACINMRTYFKKGEKHVEQTKQTT